MHPKSNKYDIGVTYYLNLHIAIFLFTIDVIFYQVIFLIVYNVQTTKFSQD